MIKDPNILFSMLNTKLRDIYPNLEALCDDLDYNEDEIKSVLATINASYDEEENQFVIK